MSDVYVRHRDRMVQESVFEDLSNTLIACRWMAGTTTREVVSPYDPGAGWQIVTTSPSQVLKIVGQHPIQLIDSFPESTSNEVGVIGDMEGTVDGQVRPNTLALDDGMAGDPEDVELGSSLKAVPYRFTVAFWAHNVGTAQALLNDLRDRYRGDIVGTDYISLYDYNVDPTEPVVAMEVDGFAYVRDTEDGAAAAHEVTMFYGQLTLTDYAL